MVPRRSAGWAVVSRQRSRKETLVDWARSRQAAEEERGGTEQELAPSQLFVVRVLADTPL